MQFIWLLSASSSQVKRLALSFTTIITIPSFSLFVKWSGIFPFNHIGKVALKFNCQWYLPNVLAFSFERFLLLYSNLLFAVLLQCLYISHIYYHSFYILWLLWWNTSSAIFILMSNFFNAQSSNMYESIGKATVIRSFDEVWFWQCRF